MSEPTPSRFTAQAASAEDVLKNQTVGLVQLDEFRKRRRDVEEMKLKDAHEQSDGGLTPRSEAASSNGGFKKKKRKVVPRGLLSFDADEETDSANASAAESTATDGGVTKPTSSDRDNSDPVRRRLTPNVNAGIPPPKVMTKARLAAENSERERLRKEFMEIQELVRASEVAIPFVFYDGSNLPGGTVRVKKGDHIWLLLERCRKVGAEMGVGGDRGDGGGVSAKTHGKKSWARIGVDDLMCVRHNIIIPHHYEIYYFIANKVSIPDHPEQSLFNYTGTSDYKPKLQDDEPLLRKPNSEVVEGASDDPGHTKVVDRRWYERNKHIYPASLWKEFKPGEEFEKSAKEKRDAQGNAFFFT